jgi:hypothetical protein
VPSIGLLEMNKEVKTMLKKLIVLSIFFFSAAIVSHPAEAASTSCRDLTGTYRIDGSLKVSVNFPDYVSATITLPKLWSLGFVAGEYFYFEKDDVTNDRVFTDKLLESYLGTELGTWEQNGCNFTIDLSPLANSLLDMLADNGFDAAIAGSTTLTGKISTRDGTNSGKFSLKIDVSSPVQGTLSISLSFKGIPVASDSMPQSGKSPIDPKIKNFISSIFSNLPRKEASLNN